MCCDWLLQVLINSQISTSASERPAAASLFFVFCLSYCHSSLHLILYYYLPLSTRSHLHSFMRQMLLTKLTFMHSEAELNADTELL